MLDESQFRSSAEAALNILMQHLIRREQETDSSFEVDEQNGVLTLAFEEPPAKFVITPNAPVRQIWISALSTSFKLDWSEEAAAFTLPRTGDPLLELVDRLIAEQLAA